MINLTDDTIQFPSSIMNDRIRELESQCWETQQLTADANSWHTSFNSRKFAELIVQECIDIVEKDLVVNLTKAKTDDEGKIWTNAQLTFSEMIKWRFGVEL